MSGAKNLPAKRLEFAIASDPYVKITIPAHCSNPDPDYNDNLNSPKCTEPEVCDCANSRGDCCKIACDCENPNKGKGIFTHVMIRNTKVIANNENPKWPGIGEPLYFGVQESGQPYNVEVFDEDTGFELFSNLADDLLGSATDYIFACSSVDATFGKNYEWAYTYDQLKIELCEMNEYNVQAGKECSEATWIPLIPDAADNYCDGKDAICLHIRMDIVPLAVDFHELNESMQMEKSTTNSNNSAVINNDVLTGTKFSIPVCRDTVRLINGRTLGGWAGARGGLIIQTPKGDEPKIIRIPSF